MSDAKIRVAVIFGGQSGEHEVSRLSATAVLKNLDPARYDVLPVGITPDGVWIPGADVTRELRAQVGVADRWGSVAAAVSAMVGVDVAFPVMHGPFGEDGTIQSLMEIAGIPYLGSGVTASAASMDKDVTKRLLSAAGLPIADGEVLRAGDETISAAARERLGLPVFVKPARAGSSLGVTKVGSWDDLAAAIETARKYDTKVMVEEAVIGREVDLGVLEHPDGSLAVGPALEIRVPGEHVFFDYDAKYLDPTTVFDIPADLPDDIAARLSELALAVFEAMGCAGLLRVDFFLRGGVEPVVNEVNTFPGFTDHSQYPEIWKTAGLSYSALLDIMLETAIRRPRA